MSQHHHNHHHHFNLTHAIALHPLPLALQSDEQIRSHRSTPDRHHREGRRDSQIRRDSQVRRDSRAGRDSVSKAAASTAYEAETPPEELHDPIRRAVVTDGSGDVEQGDPHLENNDPFDFSSKKKTQSEIDDIRSTITRRSGSLVGLPGRNALRAKKVQSFYEEQNENIERLLKPVDDHRREAKEDNEAQKLQYKIAVYGSFAANICLAILQVYGAVASGSLALFTTMADALFDPLSNITLILCHRAVMRVDGRQWPAGKARIENAGNIAFCHLMCAVSLILIVMSARDLAEGAPTFGGQVELTAPFHLTSIIAVAVAFCVKFALFLYCWGLRNRYSQIRILWEDHRNDLLINGLGLAFSLMGSKIRWWIDPMGAILLSALIATLWLRTSWKEFNLLIGRTADAPTLQLLTYISVTHSPRILAIDTVRAWYSGPRLTVEVDIVMDPEESLRETHDLAEELQVKLESLPDIERAYVHVDYETDHAPEHSLKKEL